MQKPYEKKKKNSVFINAALLCALFACPVLSCAESGPADTAPTSAAAQTKERLAMARFSSPETAQSFLSNLTESGYEGGIAEEKDEAGATRYQVYILSPVAVEKIKDPERVPWSFLGPRGKYLHAALTLFGVSTDNAFNTKYNHRSDFTLFLSPEIWLNLPRTEEGVSVGELSPRSAGGNLLDSYLSDLPVGYQATLYYRSDIPLNSSRNSPYGSEPTHRIAAGITAHGTRFSLTIADQFEKSYQEREAGQIISTDEQDRYDANRFYAGVLYDTGNRFLFGLDFVDFRTNYRDKVSSPFDRHDYGLIPSARYRLTPKVSLLAAYEYYNISYDDTNDLDSKEHYLYGGIEWKLTEKSRGYLKAGYIVKRFDRSGDTYRGFSLEVRGEHKLTPKTWIVAEAFYKPTETRIVSTAFAVSAGVSLSVSHMLTSRITATIHLAYWNDVYRGTVEDPLSDTRVRDHIYQAGIEVQYAFRRWLKARAGYTFTSKDSSESAYDYQTNTITFAVTGSF